MSFFRDLKSNFDRDGGGPAGPATRALASISREEFEKFQREYLPLAEQIGFTANDDSFIKERAGAAAERAAQAFKRGEEISRRSSEAYNLRPTGAQRRALGRSQMLRKAQAETAAANAARIGGVDIQSQLRHGLMSYARGEKQGAVGLLQHGATLDSQRRHANRQMEANEYASQADFLGKGGAAIIAAIAASSKEGKKDIRNPSSAKARDDVRHLEVKEFEYKDAPLGRQLGVIAEDSPSIATPDGKHVNLVDWLGKLTLAAQGMEKDIARLKPPKAASG